MHASAEHLQLVTFDADGTLYEDGAHFEQVGANVVAFWSWICQTLRSLCLAAFLCQGGVAAGWSRCC